MKWFKHDTDCDKSEGLSFLINELGFAGYGRWFRLLEIVASKMDASNRCCVEYPIQKWCSLLGLKRKKLTSFLELTENKMRTKVVCSGNIIRIEIPNLLKKRDEYSKKSRQKTDNVPPKNKEERNKTKDIKKEKESIYTLFEKWNSLKLITHRKLEKYKPNLNSALKNYTEQEIGKAMENYSLVVSDDKYFWSYTWGLKDFLNRGLERFIPENFKANDYINNGGNYGQGATRGTGAAIGKAQSDNEPYPVDGTFGSDA